jgi:hypothetical protein
MRGAAMKMFVIAVAAAPVAWWIMLRSGKTGWTKYALFWVASYCGVIIFGIAVAVVHSWLRPHAAVDETARLKFEERVMNAIIAAGVFSLLSVLIR